MAVVVASSSTVAFSSSSSVVIPKPTGLAVSDYMFAHIIETATNGNLQTVTAPSGWTSIRVDDDGQGQSQNVRSATFFKVALAADVLATTFTFTAAGNLENAGAILRLTGSNATAPYDSNFGSSTIATVTISQITPVQTNSLLIILGSKYDSAATTSGYAITTSNPSWTEIYDFAGSNANMACAVATRSQITATGNGTVVFSAGPTVSLGQIFSIGPATVVNLSDTLTASDTNTNSVIVSFIETLTTGDSVIATLSQVWNNTVKHVSSWLNQTKH